MSTATYSKSGLTFGLLAGAGALYWLWRRSGKPDYSQAPAAAFAGEGAHVGSFVHTRDAGPHNIRDEDGQDWDSTDEAVDESFPSSDPPANNDFRTPEPIEYPETDR